MKNPCVVLVFVLCLTLCAQGACSLPWWRRPILPSPPPTESADSPQQPPVAPGAKSQVPNWLHPLTTDEIERCESAYDFNTKWKPCLDESLQQKRRRIFSPGPACCHFIAGVVDNCYSKFPARVQDQIYTPALKEHCSQYL